MKKVKYGKTEKGVQRYKDIKTGKITLEEYQRPDLYTKFYAILLYINGLSFRRVGEIIGVDNTSVLKWYKKFSHLFQLGETIDLNQTFEDVEIDEMFTYLKKKTKNFTSGLQFTNKRIK